MDAVPVTDGAFVFMGRCKVSEGEWDYQIAKIWIKLEVQTVKDILVGDSIQHQEVEQILVSQIVEWKHSRRGERNQQQVV